MVMPSLREFGKHRAAPRRRLCTSNGTNNRASILFTWESILYAFKKNEINYMGQWDFCVCERERKKKKKIEKEQPKENTLC